MRDWLKRFFDNARQQANANKSLLDDFAPVFIYGTGTFARDVHQVLLERGFQVLGFIDHIKNEASSLNGTPIYTPEIAAKKTVAQRAMIALGLHNYQADVNKITVRLQKAGFEKILTSIDLYDIFGAELGVRYWLTTRSYYYPLITALENTEDLLADEQSKAIFRSVMEYRLTGDVTKLPGPDLVNPYHPADLPAWPVPLRFIDCGAFDGDTINDFLKNKIGIQAVAAFEPDLNNYAKLSHFVSDHKKELPEANLFPCGVYSSTKQLAFETGQGMASNISNTGDTVIQCVALDDAIPTFAPNLIKMDIEGAEYDALLGARKLITTHTPGIAVSLYHRPEHLWQLPMLIENMAPGKYSLHMRSHAMNDFELVLYAIPREQ